AEIPLAGLLRMAGFTGVSIDVAPPSDAEPILVDDAPALGLPLALFKALQLLACTKVRSAFRDFTVIDIETTGKSVEHDEVVEIAAARVRDRAIVDELEVLVRPTIPIEPEAEHVHGISNAE